MNIGWYLLSDGSKQYWDGTQWLEAQPLTPEVNSAVSVVGSSGPLAQEPPPPPVTPHSLPVADNAPPPPPTASGGRSRLFALLALGLVMANAFFPPGLLERPSRIWDRLSCMSGVDCITPWYSRGWLLLVLWWIGIILAFIFAAVRNRAGAVVAVSLAALVSLIGVFRYVTLIFELEFWDNGVVPAAFDVVNAVSVAAVFAVATFMAAQLKPAGQGARALTHTPGAPNRNNSLAVAAMIASVLTFWIVGVVLGHIALVQIRRTGEGGRGMALAGVIVGYFGWALGIIFVFNFQNWAYSQY